MIEHPCLATLSGYRADSGFRRAAKALVSGARISRVSVGRRQLHQPGDRHATGRLAGAAADVAEGGESAGVAGAPVCDDLLLLLATAGWLFAQRNRRGVSTSWKSARRWEALDELEGRVSVAHRDLTEANRLLRQEIERHQQTRDELIRAKLAALGQMSAGINHELNQPLAAMRTYADNARTYLARNLEQAAWNLQQISG